MSVAVIYNIAMTMIIIGGVVAVGRWVYALIIDENKNNAPAIFTTGVIIWSVGVITLICLAIMKIWNQ